MKTKKKLQVFVSSTFTDLKAERQAAVAAILKAGHIPAGMELFTSGDRSQMTIIEKWIDESDVYMLILGGRYGSVEPTTNLSYTELEYDYAKQQGKPMFAVVISDDALTTKVKSEGPSAIERDNQKELKLFKEKVLSNICSFFTDEKDIRLCVHESLAELADRPDLIGWISGDSLENVITLQDEIRRLRDENESLVQSLQAAERAKPLPKLTENGDREYEDLIRVLTAIKINVPPDLSAEKKEIEITLLSIFKQTKEVLLTGVTNAANAPDHETFLYHNICPKLQVHGLAENEKVTGARYRRSYITKLGTGLLSYIEKKELLAQ